MRFYLYVVDIIFGILVYIGKFKYLFWDTIWYEVGKNHSAAYFTGLR